MDPLELERLVDDHLQRLPARRAPAALLPRVMAAVRAAALPWYRREWFAWPVSWQALSAVALVAVVLACGWLLPDLSASVDARLVDVLRPAAGPVLELTDRLSRVLTAVRVMWEVVHPVAVILAVFVLMMCAACLALGTALSHIAFGGSLRS